MKESARGIIFDLDGTLVDSLTGIAVGISNACRSLGYDAVIPVEDVHRMVGKGAWNLCHRSLEYLGLPPTPELITQLEYAFVREYALTWQTGTPLYPGIADLLNDLAAENIPLAVLTNKPHEVAVPLVKSLFREVVDFSFILGFSERFPRKPEPDSLLYIIEEWGLNRDSVTLVGDSRTDCETAYNAGIRSLMVGWGYEDDPHGSVKQFSSVLINEVTELRQALLG